jgi:hypothetical protein
MPELARGVHPAFCAGMFESRGHRLVSSHVFAWRMFMTLLLTFAIIAAALSIGVVGYHYLARFSWVDSILNASMILGGMGPVGELPNDDAKLFASAYAIFSGLVFISVMGLMLGPLAHRMLHKFHLDEGDLTGDEKP